MLTSHGLNGIQELNNCTQCGEAVDVLFENNACECDTCMETTFYPLSPLCITLYNPLVYE